jgi:hypothetical protein
MIEHEKKPAAIEEAGIVGPAEGQGSREVLLEAEEVAAESAILLSAG